MATQETRYIKRHSLQARITHGTVAISCILLAITGLFVFVPALTALLPAGGLFAIRMLHRILGVLFIAVPVISAIMAPSGVKHMIKIYFPKWDSDDVTWMKRFVPYMLMPKKVHMPDAHDVKSGQRFADGVLFLAGFMIAISGIFLVIGTTFATLPAGLMLFMRLMHDVAFVMFAVFGVAHIYLGAGIFQPYRRSHRLMFGDGMVSESDAMYHWAHWARKELKSGENVVVVKEEK